MMHNFKSKKFFEGQKGEETERELEKIRKQFDKLCWKLASAKIMLEPDFFLPDCVDKAFERLIELDADTGYLEKANFYQKARESEDMKVANEKNQKLCLLQEIKALSAIGKIDVEERLKELKEKLEKNVSGPKKGF